MGYSVLYIAFGIVALWLLGEVLLQYKARLRWRVLAFAGFVGVASGVAVREVAVIVLGAIAFGVGQAYVTLSYKRGFAAGWALDLGGRGRPKVRSPHSEPVLKVSAVEEEDADGAAEPDSGDRLTDPGTAREEAGREDVYQPMPMHDDSGEYPQYGGGQQYAGEPYGGRAAPAADPYAGGYDGYDTYGGWDTGRQPAASYGAGTGQDPYAPGYGWSADQSGYPQQEQPAAASYGYDTGGYPQQPAAGSYGYDSGYDTGGYGTTGDWAPQQAADPYGYGYGYPQEAQGRPAQEQPYIPQQQPYEPPPAPFPPQAPYGGQDPQPADPYDPYRY
jgi:hypothetical protein